MLTTNKVVLYSGKWKLYKSALVTTGEDWETFTLDLKSDFDAGKYIPHGFIDIYARAKDGDNFKWYHFKPVDTQLFRRFASSDLNTDLDSKYTVLYTGNTESGANDNNAEYNYSGMRVDKETDTVFNLRLDENKQYVITFGDGVTAAKPPKNSVLYIVYLESAGPGSELAAGEVTSEKIKFVKDSLGLPEDFWESIGCSDIKSSTKNIEFMNTSSSAPYKKEETVDEIRQNAPNWFKAGGRLVTKEDYENFFKYTPLLI